MIVSFALACRTVAASEPTVIFSTGFEPSEGYDAGFTLAGQNGWTSFGSGGNGMVSNYFQGFGQQAFIGYFPPAQKDDTLNVWKPINFSPASPAQPLVKFSVVMEIADSTNGQYDDFRWSVYNTNAMRLFTLDFDNASLRISYALDDNAGYVPTNLAFTNNGAYDLVITMNFARNLWSASLNDVLVINSKPITTIGSALNLGDVDAVWAIRRVGFPGDNYMFFDNYKITAEPAPSIPPTLQPLARLPDGQFQMRLFGEPGLRYAIDASTNLISWVGITTNAMPSNGVIDLFDLDARNLSNRFYRARQVSP